MAVLPGALRGVRHLHQSDVSIHYSVSTNQSSVFSIVSTNPRPPGPQSCALCPRVSLEGELGGGVVPRGVSLPPPLGQEQHRREDVVQQPRPAVNIVT